MDPTETARPRSFRGWRASTTTISSRRSTTTNPARARTPSWRLRPRIFPSAISRTSPSFIPISAACRSNIRTINRASRAGMPLEAFKVDRFVRRRACALGAPYRLPEAFQQQMLRVVLGAGLCEQALEKRAYPARLIDRNLFLDRQVQREVEERIGLPGFGLVVAVAVAFRLVENRVVFGVQRDHVQRDAFQPLQRLAAPVLFPGVE